MNLNKQMITAVTVERFFIDKIGISKVNLKQVLNLIEENLRKKVYGYICVTNSRTTYLANQEQEYLDIQNNSFLTVPDGVPLVWIAHNRGLIDVGKVSGKDLMDAIFKISVEKGYSHYFYGCSQNTIDLLERKLKEQYPGLVIKAAISPPFQPIESYDITALAKEVNILRPTFFWCGLGAPKQERVMALLQPKLKSTICVGVGLAFEYFAGTVKRVPINIEKFGLEWFYRCFQQPIKARRFIVPFFWILIKIIKSRRI
jgi:N-acetylglucosaminyldiphosphoundecaprenol N-acetyl-beta-D-mannosaminyltransferase